MKGNTIMSYKTVAEPIKAAILQGQYEAAKEVNRIQLAECFAIGRFITCNTRKGTWGIGTLDAISQILQNVLPGLSGYSINILKDMRKFYEIWQMLDAEALTPIDEHAGAIMAIVDLQQVSLHPQ